MGAGREIWPHEALGESGGNRVSALAQRFRRCASLGEHLDESFYRRCTFHRVAVPVEPAGQRCPGPTERIDSVQQDRRRTTHRGALRIFRRANFDLVNRGCDPSLLESHVQAFVRESNVGAVSDVEKFDAHVALFLQRSEEVDQKIRELRALKVDLNQVVKAASRLSAADCDPRLVCHLIGDT